MSKREIVTRNADGTSTSSFVETTIIITIEQVQEETARRLYAMVNATDSDHFDRIQADGVLSALVLQEKLNNNETLTAEEEADRARFHAFKANKDALINAGKALQALNPIPTDYTDDKHWS